MTENEAIKELKEDFIELGKAVPCDTGWGNAINEAYSMAIHALEEIQQYRAIGTVEEFKVLKEKSMKKKPDYEGDGYYNGQIVLDTWICPNCEKHYEVDYNDYDYCPNCGQHIDHSGLTEDD